MSEATPLDQRVAAIEQAVRRIEAALGMLPPGLDAKAIADAKGVLG